MQQLPRIVTDRLAETELSCLMGLWPEIHRAWAAIDDELIVWNYDGDTGATGRENGDHR